jgi:hypothetical protein
LAEEAEEDVVGDIVDYISDAWREKKALAAKVGVSYHHANWQVIINQIES